MNQSTYNIFLDILKKHNLQLRINDLVQKYKNKKIIIYGTGILFDVVFENFDLSDLNIIGISDIKFEYDSGTYKNYPKIKPSEIKNNNPDLVLIFMQKYYIAENYFENELFPEYGKFKYEFLLKISLFIFIKNKLSGLFKKTEKKNLK